MNKTKIEWCDYTWNPVTGCYHGCPYCYARRIAHRFANKDEESIRAANLLKKNYENGGDIAGLENRSKKEPFPVGFVPTFHRYRLDEPQKLKKSSKIFVSSMGDLFGDWVPGEWIEEVFEACRRAPQHTYFFLTKNPKRYYNYFADPEKPAPENWWIGASASDRNKAHIRSECLNFMNANTFLSLEPLHEDIVEYTDWDALDWVIVGAQTGPGAIKPEKEWVQDIIDQCREAGVPVFLKDNLNWPEKIQNRPKGSEWNE